jgi:TonB family protein
MIKRAITLTIAAALLTGMTFAGPKLIRQVQAAYPAEAKQAGITGTVRLEAIIGSDGKVANVRALLGNPMFVRAAVEAVRQWQYEPVLFDGEPVAMITSIMMNFAWPAAITIEDHPGSTDGMRLVHTVNAIYPPEAKKNGVTGRVHMQALIGKDGAVASVRTLEGDPALAAAAEEAVKQWRCTPVTVAGEPVKVMVETDVTFSIYD